jgi:hypothetical protein
MKQVIFMALVFLTARVMAQSLTLVSPNGGETFVPGKVVAYSWTASVPVNRVTAEYSRDKGKTWSLIEGVSRDSGSGSNWMVPYLKHGADSALFRVTANNNAALSDVSNATFVIRAPAPDAYEPNDNFASAYQLPGLGDTVVRNAMALGSEEADFDSSKVDVDFYKMTLVGGKAVVVSMLAWPDTSNGYTYTHFTNASFYLFDQNKALVASSSSGTPISCMVPQSGVYYCKVAIHSNPDMWSKYHLSINQKDADVITLLSPNGGEIFSAMQKVDIKWEKQARIGNVSLLYSCDKGRSWNIIASIDTGTSYSWIVPALKQRCDSALIRVSASGEIGILDVSDRVFTILACPPDAYEPNNTIATAYSIAPWDSAVKNATVAGIWYPDADTSTFDADYFRISFSEGEMVEITSFVSLSSSTGTVFQNDLPSPIIDLLDESATIVDRGLGTLSSIITRSGTYYCRVSAYPYPWYKYGLRIRVATAITTQTSSMDTVAFQKIGNDYTARLIADTTKLSIDLTLNRRTGGSVMTTVLAPEALPAADDAKLKVKAVSIAADTALSSAIKTVDITIPYNTANLGGNPETSLGAFWLNDTTNRWVPASSSIDTARNVIVVHTSHFSIYGIFIRSNTAVESDEATVVRPYGIHAEFLAKKQSIAVRLSLPMTGKADLRLYDVRGKCVRRSSLFSAGPVHSTLIWGIGGLANGKYFLTSRAGTYEAKETVLIVN